VRTDYALNQRNHIFGRWSHTPSSNSAAIDTFVTNTQFLNDTYTAGWTYAISNALSNDARFNFTHSTLVQERAPLYFKGTLSTIFPAGFAQPPAGFDASGSYVLQFSITGADPILISPKALNHGAGMAGFCRAGLCEFHRGAISSISLSRYAGRGPASRPDRLGAQS
jgi:hypothetical protein